MYSLNGTRGGSRRVLFPVIALGALMVIGGCDDDGGLSGPGNFPDVRGTWVGQYSVTDCTIVEGLDPFFCTDVFFEGISLVFEMRVQQSGSALAVTADQGLFTGQLQGSVDEAGFVELSGTIGGSEDVTTRILVWDSQVVGDSIIGSWSFRAVDNTDSGFGTARVDADIVLVDPDFVLTFFNCPVQRSLALTDEVEGTLVPGDCQLAEPEGQSYIDVFAVTVSVGDIVSINMGSMDFSPFLLISDVNEQALAFDGQLGRDSAGVTGTAGENETWLIVANTLLIDETGSYGLTTEELSGAANGSAAFATPAARVAESWEWWGEGGIEEPASVRERIRWKLARPVTWKR